MPAAPAAVRAFAPNDQWIYTCRHRPREIRDKEIEATAARWSMWPSRTSSIPASDARCRLGSYCQDASHSLSRIKSSRIMARGLMRARYPSKLPARARGVGLARKGAAHPSHKDRATTSLGADCLFPSAARWLLSMEAAYFHKRRA